MYWQAAVGTGSWQGATAIFPLITYLVLLVGGGGGTIWGWFTPRRHNQQKPFPSQASERIFWFWGRAVQKRSEGSENGTVNVNVFCSSIELFRGTYSQDWHCLRALLLSILVSCETFPLSLRDSGWFWWNIEINENCPHSESALRSGSIAQSSTSVRRWLSLTSSGFESDPSSHAKTKKSEMRQITILWTMTLYCSMHTLQY